MQKQVEDRPITGNIGVLRTEELVLIVFSSQFFS